MNLVIKNIVSILICVHSQSKFHDELLERALWSLVDQTYKDFEVVIVKDSCHSGTHQVIDRFRKLLEIHDYEHEKLHLAQAKNFGLKYCGGSHIMMLDHDDYYATQKVEHQVQYLKNHPEVDLLFCQAWDIHPNGEITENCFRLGQFQTHEQIVNQLPLENCLHHGTACIKKEVFDYLSGYPEEDFALAREDHILWLRAMKAGFRFYNLPLRDYYYSLGTGGIR